MDHSTRLQYLEAMGIDVWIPRNQTLVEQVQSDVADNLQEIAQFETNSGLAVDEWSVLENQVTACQQCTLCDTRAGTVFGAGQHKADWMLIGGAPGENEEIQGQPFMGAEGYLLTEMIRAIGLQREEVFITNLLKCRPPNDRDPKVEEILACSGYLQRQIVLVQPKIILAVGRAAAQSYLILRSRYPS
jgi:DNA polymerase